MSNSKKISQFNQLSSLLDSALITVVSNKQNHTIPFSSFKTELGVTGTLITEGATLSTPILLEPTAGDYRVRGLESSKGIVTGASPDNGALISTNFINGAGGVPIIKDLLADQLEFRSIIAGDGIAVASTNGGIRISATSGDSGQNIVIVTSLDDLPAPVGAVITLEPRTIYLFTASVVDISPNRLVLGANTSIRGSSALSTSLTSSVTGSLITATDTFEVDEISIYCPNAIAIDYVSPTAKTGTGIVNRVYITECVTPIQTFNHDVFLVSNIYCEQASGSGIIVKGENSYFTMNTSLMGSTGLMGIDLTSSTNNVFELFDVALIPTDPLFVPLEGLPLSGNINTGGAGIANSLNIFGSYTGSVNILSSDARWTITNSNTLKESTNSSSIAMPVNSTETVIATIATPVKVAGVWSSIKSSRFTNDSTGRMTYIGEKDISAIVSVSCNCAKSGSGVNQYKLSVGVNGVVSTTAIASFATDNSRDPQISFVGEVDFSGGDYIELFVESADGTNNITISSANFLVRE